MRNKNAESWKPPNRLGTCKWTVLTDGAAPGKIISVRKHQEIISQVCSYSHFILKASIVFVKRPALAKPDPNPRNGCQDYLDISPAGMERGTWSIVAVCQGPPKPRNHQCSFTFFMYFDISMNKLKSLQIWSSGSQEVLSVKIRKVALGSNDFSTPPKNKHHGDVWF